MATNLRFDIAFDADTRKAAAQVGSFARGIRRDITAAIKALPDIELKANQSDAQRKIALIRNQLERLSDKRIGIDIDAGAAQAQMARLKRELADIGRGSSSVQVKADVAAAVAALGAVGSQVRRLDGQTATVKVDTDRRLIDTINSLGRLGASLKALTLPAALVAATPAVASLGAAAVAASGSLLLIPAAGFAAAAAIGTLVVGMQGFGDAMKSRADPAKFAEALKNLAPAAREAAIAVRDLGPAWKEMRLDVQQKLFAGVAAEIRLLSAAYLPVLRTGLGGIAVELSAGAKNWSAWSREASTVADTVTIFENIRQAMQRLVPAGTNVAAALKDIAVVGSSFLPGLAGGFTNVTARFREFIAAARESGQLAVWIQAGIDTLSQLGRIAGNVGSSLMSVFAAAKASGADFLTTLERLTGAMKSWLDSARGQEVLAAVFTSIRQTVDALLPGLKAIGRALADAFVTLAPVLPQLAASFSAIAQALAPVIPMLASLAATILPPIAAAVSGIVNALGPLAPALVAAALGFRLLTAAGKGLSGLGASMLGVGASADTAKGKTAGLSGGIAAVGKDADGAKGKLSGFVGALKGLGAVALITATIELVLPDLQKAINGLKKNAEGDSRGIGDYIGSLWGGAIGDALSKKLGDSQVLEQAGERIRKVADEFRAFPDVKSVEVNALTDEAQADLEALGFTVERLPFGEIRITANDDAAKTKLESTQALIRSTEATFPVNADTSPAQLRAQETKMQIRSEDATFPVNADTSPAQLRSIEAYNFAQSQKPVMSIDGEASPAKLRAVEAFNFATAQKPVMTIDGEGSPAKLRAVEAANFAAAQKPVMSIDGNPSPAQVRATDAANFASGQRPVFPVGANTAAADAAIAHATRPRSVTITVFYAGLERNIDPAQGGGRITGATGGAVEGWARGGPVRGYPTGGPVRGPGSGTSDSVRAWLSNGEHVIPAREVAAAGGQRAIYDWRKKMLAGLGDGAIFGPARRFAAGGAATPGAATPGAGAAPGGGGAVGGQGIAELEKGARAGEIAVRALIDNALAPLDDNLRQQVAPALQQVADLAAGTASQSIVALTSTLPPLLQQFIAAGLSGQMTWQQIATAVQASVVSQTGQQQQLMAGLGSVDQQNVTTAGVAGQAWAQAQSSVTGSVAGQQGQFGALQGGLGQVNSANANTAGVTGQTWAQGQASVTGSVAGQQGQFGALQGGLGQVNAANTNTAATTSQAWEQGRAAVAAAVAGQQGQFSALQSGLGAVNTAMANTASSTATSFGQVRANTGDPIRWVLQQPFNAGLIAAWNRINDFFALGKAMGPVPVGFAVGGRVPGTGSGDTVPAMLEPGEFVVSKDAAHSVGLANLDRWHRAARGSTGDDISEGMFARYAEGGAVGGTVASTIAFAKAQHGKPYIWASAGPSGYDCSGFQSALVNTALGRFPYSRLGSTGTMPWAGLTPGLTSAYGMGWFNGSPGHMAGTIAGNNVEAGGSPSMTKFVTNASGANHPQFRGHASLPAVGGVFVGGGPGGFDAKAYVENEFKPAKELARSVVGRFGPGNPPFGGQGDAVLSVDESIKAAIKMLTTATTFDQGGVLAPGALGVNLTGRPERVLSPAATDGVDRLMGMLSTRRGAAAASGGGAVQLQVSGVEAKLDRLVSVMEASARGGGGDTYNIGSTDPKGAAREVLLSKRFA